jgi:hypothetical protein
VEIVIYLGTLNDVDLMTKKKANKLRKYRVYGVILPAIPNRIN